MVDRLADGVNDIYPTYSATGRSGPARTHDTPGRGRGCLW